MNQNHKIARELLVLASQVLAISPSDLVPPHRNIEVNPVKLIPEDHREIMYHIAGDIREFSKKKFQGEKVFRDSADGMAGSIYETALATMERALSPLPLAQVKK